MLAGRLEELSRALLRHHRLAALARCPQLVAAKAVDRDWEIHVVRHGRLANAAIAHQGDSPLSVAESAVTSAEWVAPPIGPQPAALIEETEQIADWLESPGVRLIEVDGEWSWPIAAGPAASVQLRQAGNRISS